MAKAPTRQAFDLQGRAYADLEYPTGDPVAMRRLRRALHPDESLERLFPAYRGIRPGLALFTDRSFIFVYRGLLWRGRIVAPYASITTVRVTHFSQYPRFHFTIGGSHETLWVDVGDVAPFYDALKLHLDGRLVDEKRGA